MTWSWTLTHRISSTHANVWRSQGTSGQFVSNPPTKMHPIGIMMTNKTEKKPHLNRQPEMFESKLSTLHRQNGSAQSPLFVPADYSGPSALEHPVPVLNQKVHSYSLMFIFFASGCLMVPPPGFYLRNMLCFFSKAIDVSGPWPEITRTSPSRVKSFVLMLPIIILESLVGKENAWTTWEMWPNMIANIAPFHGQVLCQNRVGANALINKLEQAPSLT